MEEINLQASNKLFGELEDKNRIIGDYARERMETGNMEGAIQARMHQLAIVKILVNIHNHSPFLMVQAHTELGESYFHADYHEQAIEHITSALKINGNLFNSHPDSKQYHITLLTALGRCYLVVGSIEEALKLIQKALKMSKSLVGDAHVTQAPILLELAHVHSKQKEYNKALDYAISVWEIYESNYGLKSEIMIDLYANMANLYYQNHDLQNAIDTIRRKLKLMDDLNLENEKKVHAGDKLANWLKESGRYSEALQAIEMTEKMLEKLHGNVHKRTAKIKRMKCMLMIRSEEYEKALSVSHELKEIDKALFGTHSLHYAKDLKVTGTILMILKKNNEAREYFNNAFQAYKRIGNKKAMKEIKSKLDELTQYSDDISKS